jgi:hypothetical protein
MIKWRAAAGKRRKTTYQHVPGKSLCVGILDEETDTCRLGNAQIQCLFTYGLQHRSASVQ